MEGKEGNVEGGERRLYNVWESHAVHTLRTKK